ncbi:molybdenum cofactor sulfurtransferase [Geosmithia morbida]|uniref:Molybdenum cofactor sulfurase n=1 Tax=Geosmithia morbida TaxID=1094350 RepID=A0A9P5D447_9HYPO|nr:molybdenum cofactor sulfurtransferase [Geosmithia morbida]KAF4122450.1 molybdenum cofactor sulfurtransferase [Geosmithia morbida]
MGDKNNPPSLDEYNDAVEAMRRTEYPMLQDSVYLDHAGATLPPKSLMDAFAHDMTTVLYGNPHSASWPSQQSTSRIDNARLRLLQFLGADPSDFDLVFVANATAGVKLVLEGMRSLQGGFLYAHHRACHTSIVGVREEARASVCLDDDDVAGWVRGGQSADTSTCAPAFASVFGLGDTGSDTTFPPSATLVAYSAQSHMDGRRYPLSWSSQLRGGRGATLPRVYTLLDAASLAATSPLNLGQHDTAPDFTVLSLYKIFGFPDLGALVVRRDAQSVFSRRAYFGGGTVDMVLCGGAETWHAPKTHFLHERLEDGTLPFHSIMALDTAMTVHHTLFGSMARVSSHVADLTNQLSHGLDRLRHGNGEPVCFIYGCGDDSREGMNPGRGPIVSFNLKNSAGAWISLTEFGKLAQLRKMHIRTGGVCSPCAIASALDLQPWEMRSNFSVGYRCGTDSDIMSGKPTGVIRASLGAMSTRSDVSRFVDFIREFYVEAAAPSLSPAPIPDDANTRATRSTPGLEVGAITLYPIKSCGGLSVPAGSRWEIRPEGLAWDREWCLVHRGSGHTLSQKRYPRMALLKPSIDFDTGTLRVEHRDPGDDTSTSRKRISVPLSVNPALFDSTNRHVPSPFPTTNYDVPSPPDSDSEKQQRQRPDEGNILLANESPILMIYSASVDALNRCIQDREGGPPIDETAFRANISLRPASHRSSTSTSAPNGDGAPMPNGNGTRAPSKGPLSPFAEDSWTSLRIGPHAFKMLGACRRCQMVCVDQTTAERRQEPYVTLAKTRRFDGKVFFGCHMRLDCDGDDMPSEETQCPTISVGDPVSVEDGGYE